MIASFLLAQLWTPVLNINGKLFAGQLDQSDCQKILDKARNLYYEGRFDESVNLVRSCIASEEITKDERRQAYKILAQIALARNDKDKARNAVRRLLQIDPDYKPTIEQETPSYVELVESVRAEMDSKVSHESHKAEIKEDKKGISKWWYYSAGAVVAGSAYFLLSKDGNKKDEPLKEPPEWDDEN